MLLGSAPEPTNAAHSAPSETNPFDVREAVITITEVKTPWYALRFLLKNGFEKSLPEYTAIKGLLQKNYAIHDGNKYFGGFYLWQSKADAEAWFNTAWFERTEKSYGERGRVSYFTVRDYQTFAKEADAKGDYWTVIHHTSAESARHTFSNAQGLLRVYLVNDATTGQAASISLWNSKDEAERYFAVAKISQSELTYTDTPLLLNKIAQ
jgi:heme-degrading monooxygenase HmoA